MAMTERSRNALYEGLTGFIDPEAVGEMLSYFPARDVEEPASRELVRAECALVRADLHRSMGDLRTELRAEVRSELDAFRVEIRADMIDLRAEVRSAMRWTIGAMVSLTGVLVAAMATFG